MQPSLRLFLAAYPPLGVVQGLQSRASGLPLPEHKAVPPEQVHLTLLFMGDRSSASLPDIESSIAASCKGIRACVVRPRRLLSLPDKGPARLVTVETDTPPSLLELHKRLANRLADRTRRGNPFLPHLTLLRFPGMGVDVRVNEDLATPEQDATTFQFEVGSVCLVKSTLHPKGSRHEVLREFALG